MSASIVLDGKELLVRDYRSGTTLCLCGCGEVVGIAAKTDRHEGWVRGRAKRYVVAHCPRGIGGGAKPPYTVDPDTDCWNWNRYVDPGGYGRAAGARRAHRHMWETANGPVPEGLELDHLCRNRRCVNPAHLEPVTRKVNVRRGTTSKLTEAMAEAIRRSPLSNKELAATYGVSTYAIYDVRRGRTWR